MNKAIKGFVAYFTVVELTFFCLVLAGKVSLTNGCDAKHFVILGRNICNLTQTGKIDEFTPIENYKQSKKATKTNMNETLTKELICPISLELMAEPIQLRTCGHNFDKKSINKYIEHINGTSRYPVTRYSCPTCRKTFYMSDLLPNRSLKGIIEALKDAGNSSTINLPERSDQEAVFDDRISELKKRDEILQEQNKLQGIIVLLVSILFLFFVYAQFDLFFRPFNFLMSNIALIAFRIVIVYPLRLVHGILYCIGETFVTTLLCVIVFPYMLFAMIIPFCALAGVLKCVCQLFSNKGAIVETIYRLISIEQLTRLFSLTFNEMQQEIINSNLWAVLSDFFHPYNTYCKEIAVKIKEAIPRPLSISVDREYIKLIVFVILFVSTMIYIFAPVESVADEYSTVYEKQGLSKISKELEGQIGEGETSSSIRYNQLDIAQNSMKPNTATQDHNTLDTGSSQGSGLIIMILLVVATICITVTMVY